MFKFLKEIKASIKEGIDEAKEEMAEEAREAAEGKTVQASKSGRTPAEEFGVALGAPYREIYTVTMGMYNDPEKVFTLREMALPESAHSDYASILKRDFDIVDDDSLRESVKLFWKELDGVESETPDADPAPQIENDDHDDDIGMTGYAHIYRALEEGGLLDADPSQAIKQVNRATRQAAEAVLDMENRYHLGERGGDAFRLSVLSHIIAGGGALGYIDRTEATKLLDPVARHALDVYRDWDDYAAGFLAGEIAWGGNSGMGRKILTKTVAKLQSHERSPWMALPFAMTNPALH